MTKRKKVLCIVLAALLALALIGGIVTAVGYIAAQIAMISGESLLTPRRLLATMRSLRRPPGARSAM